MEVDSNAYSKYWYGGVKEEKLQKRGRDLKGQGEVWEVCFYWEQGGESPADLRERETMETSIRGQISGDKKKLFFSKYH